MSDDGVFILEGVGLITLTEKTGGLEVELDIYGPWLILRRRQVQRARGHADRRIVLEERFV